VLQVPLPSHLPFRPDERTSHLCPLGWNFELATQCPLPSHLLGILQTDFERFSQTRLAFRNVQSAEQQSNHHFFVNGPGSQSSPLSTIPLPQVLLIVPLKDIEVDTDILTVPDSVPVCDSVIPDIVLLIVSLWVPVMVIVTVWEIEVDTVMGGVIVGDIDIDAAITVI